MAFCGVPTFACVLLLFFLAGLYAGVNSAEDAGHLEEAEVQEGQRIIVRVARASSPIKVKGTGRSKKKTNKKDDDEESLGGSIPARPPKKGGKKVRLPKGKIPRQDRGDKRPRPGGNKDGLPAGVNRQMMRLAEKIHSASTPFAARMFSTLTATSPRHIVMSPFSIHTVLTMTMLGAKGQTEQEMSLVLGHKQAKLRKKKPHKAYKALLASLVNSQQDFKVYSANAVFVKPGIPLEDAFRQGLIGMYNASFGTFQMSHPQGPEAPINTWVSQATRDKIQGLVPAGTITPLTALIIVNAVYFNAAWSKPFPASLTKPDQFNALGGAVQTVDMMSVVHVFGYADRHNTEVVELLYQGDRLAMYILLPNTTSNITQLQKSLVGSDKQDLSPVDALLDNLGRENIKLFLPKFRLESGLLHLKESLKEMGIKQAFDAGKADFSGISSTGDLYIDAVLHKAFIDVNENGTEAAAATAGVLGFRSSIMGKIRDVRVDRPFMFIIRDKIFKEILFIGTYIGQN